MSLASSKPITQASFLEKKSSLNCFAQVCWLLITTSQELGCHWVREKRAPSLVLVLTRFLCQDRDDGFHSIAGTLWQLLFKIWGLSAKGCCFWWSIANICDQWELLIGELKAVSLSRFEFWWCPARETNDYGIFPVGSEEILGEAARHGSKSHSHDRQCQWCRLCNERPVLWYTYIYHRLCEYTVLTQNHVFFFFLRGSWHCWLAHVTDSFLLPSYL